MQILNLGPSFKIAMTWNQFTRKYWKANCIAWYDNEIFTIANDKATQARIYATCDQSMTVGAVEAR